MYYGKNGQKFSQCSDIPFTQVKNEAFAILRVEGGNILENIDVANDLILKSILIEPANQFHGGTKEEMQFYMDNKIITKDKVNKLLK